MADVSEVVNDAVAECDGCKELRAVVANLANELDHLKSGLVLGLHADVKLLKAHLEEEKKARQDLEEDLASVSSAGTLRHRSMTLPSRMHSTNTPPRKAVHPSMSYPDIYEAVQHYTKGPTTREPSLSVRSDVSSDVQPYGGEGPPENMTGIPLEVSVSFSAFAGAKTHAVYDITATKFGRRGREDIVLFKRFSELMDLHQTLEKANRGAPLPTFPKKKVFGSKSPEFLEKRQAALNLYFAELCSIRRDPAVERTLFVSLGFDP